MGSLIINADDFGKDPLRDGGILLGLFIKVVTSVSVIVIGKIKFVSALTWLRKKMHISVGLHIDITSENLLIGESTLLYASIYEDKRDCWMGAINDEINLALLYNEVEKQVIHFIDLFGFVPDHIDCHDHVHIASKDIYYLFESIRQKYIIPFMRFPCEKSEDYKINAYNKKYKKSINRDIYLGDRSSMVTDMRDDQCCDIVLYQRSCELLQDTSDIQFIGTFFGHLRTYSILTKMFDEIRYSHKVYELMVHPGLNLWKDKDNKFSSIHRLNELLILTSCVFVHKIKNMLVSSKIKIRFTSFYLLK